MIEDDIYRSSTQYRYWSYTRDVLASLRQRTNELASERVRAAFGRIRDAKNAQNGQVPEQRTENENAEARQPAQDVETLTVEEELKVVHWGCSKIIETGKVMSPPVPMEIRVRNTILYAPPQAMVVKIFCTGNSYPVPAAILPHQLSHDLPSQADPHVCFVPCNQD